jgi:hypothetical protein
MPLNQYEPIATQKGILNNLKKKSDRDDREKKPKRFFDFALGRRMGGVKMIAMRED